MTENEKNVDLVTNAMAFALTKTHGGTLTVPMTHKEYDTTFGRPLGVNVKYNEESEELTISSLDG